MCFLSIFVITSLNCISSSAVCGFMERVAVCFSLGCERVNHRFWQVLSNPWKCSSDLSSHLNMIILWYNFSTCFFHSLSWSCTTIWPECYFFVAHPMPFLDILCRLYISLSLLCKPFMSLKVHRGICQLSKKSMLEIISYYRCPGPFIKIIIICMALTMPRSSWLMVLIPGKICCESICIEKSGQWLNLNVSKPVCFGHWVM